MKSITKICLLLIAVTAITSLPAGAQTADTTTNSANTATNAAPALRRNMRAGYRGKITAVDGDNMTLTLSRRAGAEFKIKITSKTKITKDRQPATFADAVAGMNVAGQGTKDAEGNWDATTLRITTRQPRQAAPPAASDSGQK